MTSKAVDAMAWEQRSGYVEVQWNIFTTGQTSGVQTFSIISQITISVLQDLKSITKKTQNVVKSKLYVKNKQK